MRRLMLNTLSAMVVIITAASQPAGAQVRADEEACGRLCGSTCPSDPAGGCAAFGSCTNMICLKDVYGHCAAGEYEVPCIAY